MSDDAKLAFVDPDLADWFHRVKPQFEENFPGSTLSVAQGYRTPGQQLLAATKGASRYDGKTSFSVHQFFPSRAIDLAVIDHGHYVTDGSDWRYHWLGGEAETEGFIWGGRFVKPDPDHVQIAGPNPTLAQVADGLAMRQELA